MDSKLKKIIFLTLFLFVATGLLLAETPTSEEIVSAIEKGKTQRIKAYIKNGLSPNIDLGGGVTPLMVATFHYQPSIVTFLLEKGANPNAQTREEGIAAIHLAPKDTYLKIVKILLDGGADPSITDTKGDSAILLASAEVSPKVIKLLIDAGADPNTMDREGNTPLCLAIKHAMSMSVMAATKTLLKSKADPNISNKRGYTPLMYAAKKGLSPVTKLLLKADADPSAVTITGYSALMYTVTTYNMASYPNAKMLLKAGADPNAQNKLGRTALISAIGIDELSMISILTPYKPDFTLVDNKGRNALCYSTYFNHPKVTLHLLNEGMDPNVSDNDGNTPLFNAIKNNRIPSVKALLKKGADPNTPNKKGSTPLHIIITKKEAKVKELTESEKRDFTKEVKSDRTTIIELLIKSGADVNKKDALGRTALDLADKATRSLLEE